MNITKKKIFKYILIILLIIIMFLLSWLFLGGKSYSQYSKNVNMEATTKIAKPIFIVDGADNIVIDGIEDKVYNFSIKNYDNTGVSDVGMNYYIQIVNSSDANLTFELTKNGQPVNLTNNRTNLILIPGLAKKSDNYKLAIKYNGDSTASTNDILGNVQIKVEAEQAEIK